jgi:hypothetical protein
VKKYKLERLEKQLKVDDQDSAADDNENIFDDIDYSKIPDQELEELSKLYNKLVDGTATKAEFERAREIEKPYRKNIGRQMTWEEHKLTLEN